MREIKFRAWDPEIGEMIYSNKRYDQYFFEFKHSKLLCFRIDENGYPGTIHEPPSPKAIELDNLMQFTGLLDKNGKEIWEGDITKNERGEIGVIKFINGSFVSAYIHPFDWDPMEQVDGLFNRNEVIGNIYENPELLNL